MIGMLLGLVLSAGGRADAAHRREELEPNGPALNGIRLGGDPSSIRSLLAVDLKKGVTWKDGGAARGVVLEGTALRAREGSGTAFIGALLDGTTTDRRDVRLR